MPPFDALDPLRLVILDLDGVLIEFHPGRRLSALAAATGLAQETIQAAIWDSDFEPAAEAGAWPTGEAYLTEFNRRLGAALDRATWVAARQAAMVPRDDVLAWAEALARRVPLALLTNNGSLLLESLPDLLPALPRIFGTRLHASFEFRARKPDPAVYAGLLARHGVVPAEAMMVDDSAANVRGAIEAGLEGHLYRGLAPLARDLADRIPPDVAWA